jgi:hypothetical protein
MNKSEHIFEEYLNEQGIDFQRDFPTNAHNVDFRLHNERGEVLCDVKEVRDSGIKGARGVRKAISGRIDAQDHLRGDIKKLRKKFSHSPAVPLLLVSMNFSSTFFTALTVRRALLGEVGVLFDRHSGALESGLHHLHRGNAALRQKTNRSISGLLLFDVRHDNHCLFKSPYANHVVPSDFSSDVRVIELKKDDASEDIAVLNHIVFWNYDAS